MKKTYTYISMSRTLVPEQEQGPACSIDLAGLCDILFCCVPLAAVEDLACALADRLGVSQDVMKEVMWDVISPKLIRE